MIDFEGKVRIDDLPEAQQHSDCIRDCLRMALIGHISGDYNMVKDRIQDAMKSIDKIDDLKQRKESFDLASEFLSEKVIEPYERQTRVIGRF